MRIQRCGLSVFVGAAVLCLLAGACTAGSVSTTNGTPSGGACCEIRKSNVTICSCDLDGGAASCVPVNDASATLVETCTK